MLTTDPSEFFVEIERLMMMTTATKQKKRDGCDIDNLFDIHPPSAVR
jgi:hypothetical protein